MNSLYNQLNGQSQTFQNPQGNNLEQIRQMMNLVRSSSDPRMALQTMIQSNPQMQNVMNYINQNGGDPKAAFYNLARQKGVDPEEVLNILRK